MHIDYMLDIAVKHKINGLKIMFIMFIFLFFQEILDNYFDDSKIQIKINSDSQTFM